MLLCPNGPQTSLNWISKLDNRREELTVLMYILWYVLVYIGWLVVIWQWCGSTSTSLACHSTGQNMTCHHLRCIDSSRNKNCGVKGVSDLKTRLDDSYHYARSLNFPAHLKIRKIKSRFYCNAKGNIPHT